MKGTTDQLDKLKTILQKEVPVFHAFIKLERQLQENLLSHVWKDLSPLLKSLKSTAQQLVHLEEERERAYKSLKTMYGMEKEETFYDLCSKLSSTDREELASLYRELKHAVLEVHSITGGIDVYCASNLSTMGKFLDELLPENSNRTYSHRGALRKNEQPLLVNRTL